MESAGYLCVHGKHSRTIRLMVSPQADFRSVLRTLESIDLPPTRVSAEHIRFAILELLSNSIRAHRERGVSRDIHLDLTASDGRLVVAIRDFGGGFDPAVLPYPLDCDLANLDVHSDRFEEYQQRSGHKRFGMGIYVAKRTFDEFRLVFLDQDDRPGPWLPGRVVGTLITVSVTTEEEACGGAEGRGALRE